MKVIEVFHSTDTTEECVSVLNKIYGASNWKRKWKLHIKNEGGIRVFTDGSKTITLADSYAYETDLSVHKDVIADIKKESKHLYSWDYSDIYFNPDTKTIMFIGGDGGIIYSKNSSAAKELLDEGFEDYNDVILDPTKVLSFPGYIVEFEAEYFPEVDKGWIKIGEFNSF